MADRNSGSKGAGEVRRDFPAANQEVRESGDLGWLRLIGAEFDLLVHGVASLGDAFGEASGAGEDGDLGVQTGELKALHFEAQAHGVPPADIGAAVSVVADPGGQHHGAWVEFGPAVGPGATGDGNQRGVEPVDGIAAVGDRGDGLVELAAQGDRRRAVGFEGGGWVAAGRLGEGLVDRQWQGEGGMGGEDGGEAGAFGERLVFRPADRAVVGVGT